MLSDFDFLTRLIVAMCLGGAIGYERELREQPAGLRTHLLVALGSAVFLLVSCQFYHYQHYDRTDKFANIDVGRIAAQIVSGIGFLGGGAILQSGMRIKGLTTAASLWLVAGVGMAAGAGMYLIACASTILSLFALVVLRYVVEEPRKRLIELTVRIDLEGEFISRAALIDYLAPIDLKLTNVDYSRNISTNRSRLKIDVKLGAQSLEEPLMKRLEALPGARRVKVERPGQ